MSAASNVLRGQRFRELVSLYLGASGLDGVHVRPRMAISEALRTDAEVSDIWGIGRFAVDARSDNSLDRISDALDHVGHHAKQDAKDFGVVVQFRRERATGEMYCLTTLKTMAEIMRALEGKEASS